MHIENAWYVAAWSSEIGAGMLFARKLFGRNVVLFRNAESRLVALDDLCAHRAAPLSCGKHERGNIRCMYHGLVFDGEGQCVEVPGQKRISSTLRVRSYPVHEVDGFAWIWPGDPAKADTSLVFRATAHNSPGWKGVIGSYTKFAANAQLIADNLLDFSHLAFVHIGSIGNPEFAQSRPIVERGEDWITVSHWNPGICQAPNNKGVSKLPDLVDRFQTYTWHLRGNIFDQISSVSPADTGGNESTAPETIRKHTYIMITPETQTTAHYFWSAFHNDYLTDVQDVTELQHRKLASAFEEDRFIIEAQQRALDEHPDAVMQALAVDANLLEARRMLGRLVAEEESSVAAGSSSHTSPRVVKIHPDAADAVA